MFTYDEEEKDMRVCMITGAFPPAVCGVGDYANLLIEHLSEMKDIEVSVITSRGYNLKPQYCKVYDIIENWTFTELGKILEVIRASKPDIVHIQYPTDQYKKNTMINILPLLLKAMGFKVVITIHEYSYFGLKYRIRNLPNLSAADRIIVADPVYIKHICRVLPFKRKKICYIPIFSNIPVTRLTESDKLELRSKVAEEGTIILGFFGFINEKKGFEHILTAVKSIKDSGKKVKLLYIGEFKDDSEYHKSILGQISSQGLSENIISTGYLDKSVVADYLSIVDCMVFPFMDGLSPRNGTFLAALNQGVNIITTKPQGENNYEYEKVHFIDRYEDIAELVCKIVSSKGCKAGKNGDISNKPADIASAVYRIYEELLYKSSR